jgi:pyrimidine-nucleoside phosphorylase
LLIVPLCLLEGLRVPMMAGRGLGHTGGTLDKLEAVGWNVRPTVAAARQQVAGLGGIIMGQTDEIAPLDKRLYAMRDVTATVESLPLIVGSILSKKLAEGVGCLVMDVKFGSGAFMQRYEDARELALALRRVGTACGLQMRCLLTSMDSPLGATAGNALEVAECVEVMQGGGPADTRDLTLELATEMVRLAQPDRSEAEVRAALARHLDDGSAFEMFCRLATAQGGDVDLLTKKGALWRARYQVPVLAPEGAGHIAKIDVRQLGLAVLELGGGRRHTTDRIDPWVGIAGLKRAGAAVQGGEPVCVVHASDLEAGERAAALVRAAHQFGSGSGAAVTAADSLIRERF